MPDDSMTASGTPDITDETDVFKGAAVELVPDVSDMSVPSLVPEPPKRSPTAIMLAPLAEFAADRENASPALRREAARKLDEIADCAIMLANYRISRGANPKTAGRYAADDLIRALKLDELFPELAPGAIPRGSAFERTFDDAPVLPDAGGFFVDDDTASGLIAEFGLIRDGLVDDGPGALNEIAKTIDALVTGINRRDLDEIDRATGRIEEMIAGIGASGPGNEDSVRTAALGPIFRGGGKLLKDLEKGLRTLRRLFRDGRRGSGRSTGEEPNDDGVVIPQPPSGAGGAEKPEEHPGGIGDNQPPSPLEDEDDQPGGVRENELSPGIKVRGDPSSRRWGNFKDILGHLSGKSRDAAESLVNGGELTTSSGTRRDIANITRRGGLTESTEAYDAAVRKAGGDPENVMARPQGDVMIRKYKNPEDGTQFIHRRPIENGGPAVEVQIVRKTPSGLPRPEIDHRIKIRFEKTEVP